MKPCRNLRTKDGVALEILRKWETGECSTTAINLFTCWSRQWPNQHETSRISWIISLNVLGPPRRLAFERWLIAAVAFLVGAFQRFHQNYPRSSSFPVPLHSSWSFSLIFKANSLRHCHMWPPRLCDIARCKPLLVSFIFFVHSTKNFNQHSF